MSTNSRIGKSYPLLTGSADESPDEARARKAKPYSDEAVYVIEHYADGTGPCGLVCSCSEYCKDSGTPLSELKDNSLVHAANIARPGPPAKPKPPAT